MPYRGVNEHGLDREVAERAARSLPFRLPQRRNQHGEVRVIQSAPDAITGVAAKLSRLQSLAALEHIDSVTCKRGGFSRYMRHAR